MHEHSHWDHSCCLPCYWQGTALHSAQAQDIISTPSLCHSSCFVCSAQIAYSVIEPGIKKKYRTFVTHPWIVREVTTGRRMMLNDSMVGG